MWFKTNIRFFVLLDVFEEKWENWDMNIYLDIDGVLIDKNHKPVKNVVKFLKYMTKNHNCYWLTTHCRTGGNRAFEYLEDKLPAKALKYIKKIKPTDWNTLKTEAIDFTKDFLWYDDFILPAEENVLKEHDCLKNLVRVEDSKLIY